MHDWNRDGKIDRRDHEIFYNIVTKANEDASKQQNANSSSEISTAGCGGCLTAVLCVICAFIILMLIL